MNRTTSCARKETASTSSSRQLSGLRSTSKVTFYNLFLNINHFLHCFLITAHKAERHVGAFQSKADARQNRVVDLEFNYSRPTARDQTSRRRGRDAAPSPPTSVNVVDSVDGLRGGAGVRNEEHAGPGRAPDMSAESFPSLGASGGGGAAGGRATAAADSLARRLNPSSGHSTSWASGHKVPKEEDFPSLPGGPSPVHSAPTTVNGGARRKQLQQQQARGPKTREEEFPSLGGPAKAIPASLRYAAECGKLA